MPVTPCFSQFNDKIPYNKDVFCLTISEILVSSHWFWSHHEAEYHGGMSITGGYSPHNDD